MYLLTCHFLNSFRNECTEKTFPCFLGYGSGEEEIPKTHMCFLQAWVLPWLQCQEWWLLSLIFCLFKSTISAFEELPFSVCQQNPPNYFPAKWNPNCSVKIFDQELPVYFVLVPSNLTLEKAFCSSSFLPSTTQRPPVFQYTYCLLFLTNLPFKSLLQQYWHHHKPVSKMIKLPLLVLGCL